jgi:diguanylate cyclase (GGDEF)-like protein/PAS domain S-box-containing protein
MGSGSRRAFVPVLTRSALVAVLYFLGARAGLAVAFENRNVTTVWPPTGIAVAALIVFGLGVWPGVAVGALVANIANHAGLATSAAIAVGNTTAPVVAVIILRRWLRFDTALERMRDVVALLLVGGFGAMTISASLGTASLLLTHAATPSTAASVWLVWWIGDAIGVVIFSPFLLLASRLTEDSALIRRRGEAMLLVAFTIVVAVVVFTVHTSLAYVILVPTVWGALSFEQAGAALITVLLAAIAVTGTVGGHGPFASGTPTQDLVSLQIFNAILAFAGLSLASVVTGRRRAEQRLHASAVRYRLLAEQADDPIWTHDLEGRITYANPSASRISHATSIFELVGSRQEDVVRRAVGRLLEIEERTSYEVEVRGPGGAIVALEMSAVLVRTDGEPSSVQVIGRDITSRKLTEGQLRRRVLRDPVTGLANRMLVTERLEYLLAIDEPGRTGVALFVCDIDGMGRINASEGYGGGDALLRAIAHRLNGLVRTSDMVARFGGDEFALVVSPIAGEDEARALGERVGEEVRAASPLRPTVSVGIALQNGGGSNVHTLVQRAMLALRRAKGRGRGAIEVYGPHVEPEAAPFDEIRTRLERSLER